MSTSIDEITILNLINRLIDDANTMVFDILDNICIYRNKDKFEKIILDFIEISTCIEDGYNEIKYFKTLDEEEFKLKAKEKNE